MHIYSVALGFDIDEVCVGVNILDRFIIINGFVEYSATNIYNLDIRFCFHVNIGTYVGYVKLGITIVNACYKVRR